MFEPENPEVTRRRGIYLLPNLFTTAALFAGFYSIVAAMQGDFEIASMTLFIAMVMDALDGRVARLTGTQSDFGAQYDSLSDMVCFGITPALVVYSWGLQYLGKFGWLSAFVYAAATALRLARFNIQAETQDKRFFIGLSCTAAAAVIASMVWVGTDFAIPGKRISEFVAVVTIIMAILMVSNIKYHSFKEIDFKGKVPFVALLIMVFFFALITWDPPKVLFSMSFSYAMSGPILLLKNKIKNKRIKLKNNKQENTEEVK